MKQKLHVAFLIRSLNAGGAERQLVTLINGLNPDLFNISLITFYPGGKLIHKITFPDISIYSLDKSSRWDLVSFVFKYIKLIRKIKPDILHGYLPMANNLTILAKLFSPDLITIFGIRSAYRDFSGFDWLARLEYKTEAFLAGFSNQIITNSEAGKKVLLERKFPINKISVIPNGIDTNTFYPDHDTGLQLRQEWGYTPDNFVVGLIGRLDTVKDHPTFLAAANRMIAKYANARFICVGSGDPIYTKYLMAMSDQYNLTDKVLWLPTQSNMNAIYNALDICCNVSLSEGFSNVIGEAMSSGVPCIATDVGDSKLIIGNTGIIIPPKNPDALEKALTDMLELNIYGRTILGINARNRIINQYSNLQLVHRTEDLIKILF